MFIGNINTIPSIVNLPGQGRLDPTYDFAFQNQNGNSFQVDGNANDNVITGNFSISCLIKVDPDFFSNIPAPGSSLVYKIVDKQLTQNGFPRGYGLNLTSFTNAGDSNSKSFRIEAYRPGAGIVGGRVSIVFNQNLVENIIYLVVATVDVASGEVKLYVKNSTGTPFATQTRTLSEGSGNILNSTSAFTIANTSPSSTTQGFQGEIDEVAIWTDVLNEGQVNTLTALYRSNNSVDLSTVFSGSIQPAGWYKMGEGAEFSNNVWTMPNDGNSPDFKNLKSDNVLESARQSPGLVPQFGSQPPPPVETFNILSENDDQLITESPIGNEENIVLEQAT